MPCVVCVGQVNYNKVWTTLIALLLPFVFIFGNSIRIIFECVVFLFVVHPFDVGDIIVTGPQQEAFKVILSGSLLPEPCHA